MTKEMITEALDELVKIYDNADNDYSIPSNHIVDLLFQIDIDNFEEGMKESFNDFYKDLKIKLDYAYDMVISDVESYLSFDKYDFVLHFRFLERESKFIKKYFDNLEDMLAIFKRTIQKIKAEASESKEEKAND